jgi:signal transduction histidine kinase
MRRLTPSRLLRLERRSVRFRLTLFYAGVFLLLGACVLVVVYVVAAHSSAVVSVAVRRDPGTGITTVHPVPVPPGDVAGLLVHTHAVDLPWLLQVSIFELIVITVGAAWLGWIAAGRVLKPIQEITTTARTISAGNLHQRLALVGPDDEFKRLGDTLDELLARLETSFETQRRFVANASHELRTPLTLERTLLQLALADPAMSTETLRATCEELLATGREQERLQQRARTRAA